LVGSADVFGAIVTSVKTSDNAYHVFAPGKAFSFTLTLGPGSSGVTGYQWVDWKGNSLGVAVAVADSSLSFAVNSPAGATLDPGYYGLRLLPEGTVLGEAGSGTRHELGFVLLQPFAADDPHYQRSTTWPYGMTHGDIADPYLQYKWTKTTWPTAFWKWDAKTSAGSFDAAGWRSAFEKVSKHGRTDLPLVTGEPWSSTPVDLKGIGVLAASVFKATPEVLAWEWGIEEAHEGLDFATSKAFYDVLAPKMREVRTQANSSGAAKTLLVHQLEGVWSTIPTRADGAKAFFQSEALRYVDVLSLHPYPWPDFISPDKWLDAHLKTVNAFKAASPKPHLPIWMTEMGCTTDDAGLGAAKMVDGENPVSGLSRSEAAVFLVKTHAIAFAEGVSRIYWYNYRDSAASDSDAEQHFGLRDFWGYPKPAYAAYANFINRVGAKVCRNVSHSAANIQSYHFSDGKEACYVVWAYPAPANPVSVVLSSLTGGARVTSVTDTAGKALPVKKDGSVALDNSPLFITAVGRR
jgi:hypothetical protein